MSKSHYLQQQQKKLIPPHFFYIVLGISNQNKDFIYERLQPFKFDVPVWSIVHIMDGNGNVLMMIFVKNTILFVLRNYMCLWFGSAD